MYSESHLTATHHKIALLSSPTNTVAEEALAGLLHHPKTLPPKLFYDQKGCDLFQQITALPEYYLTRTERALLEIVAPQVATATQLGTILVEYGASDEYKAEGLLRQIRNRAAVFATYIPIDIASEGLVHIRRRLHASIPELEVSPLAADFTAPVILPNDGRPRLGFFPGSTIGNFEPAAAIALLGRMRVTLGTDARLLIGVDLRKDPAILLPAYNDASGVTAAFNLNILARLNREADANFVLSAFVHRAIWNDEESRIEMHLVSSWAQTVDVAGHAIRFAAGETIHTENSYKHTLDGFKALARVAGWRSRHCWTDAERRFSLHLLEVERRAL